MQFFKAFASMAIIAFAAVVSAQMRSNAITSPASGAVLEAGETYDIEWINPRGDRVTLVVMSGPENQLVEVATIAENIPNDGSFEWTAPEDLPANGAYTIRISYDNNPANYNYSDRFVFQSSVTATSSASSSRPASTSSASSASSSESTTETESETTTSTESETATSTATSSAATTTGSQSSMSTSSRSRTSSTEEPSSTTSQTGAPRSGASTLSSPITVMVALLAAALFFH